MINRQLYLNFIMCKLNSVKFHQNIKCNCNQMLKRIGLDKKKCTMIWLKIWVINKLDNRIKLNRSKLNNSNDRNCNCLHLADINLLDKYYSYLCNQDHCNNYSCKLNKLHLLCRFDIFEGIEYNAVMMNKSHQGKYQYIENHGDI